MTWNRTSLLAALPVAAVAVIAGIVSYSHIEALGLATGQTIADARLLPLAVDGLIVAGSVILLAGSGLGWLGVVLGVAATLFANVESGLPHGQLAATVAAWPAIAFSVASFVLERWLKAQVSQGGHGGRTEAPADPGTACHADIMANDPAMPGQCSHGVAASADEAVVNAFLHARDCLGQIPSQRQLAATFGLHRTKVAALVGPLNGHAPGPSGATP